MQTSVVLQTPIADLPVTEKFYRQCRRMGFSTIGDILSVGIDALAARPHFSYRWLSDLLEFLSRYELEGLLRR